MFQHVSKGAVAMEIIKHAEKKTYERDANLTKTVADIIERVKREGDAALLRMRSNLTTSR